MPPARRMARPLRDGSGGRRLQRPRASGHAAHSFRARQDATACPLRLRRMMPTAPDFGPLDVTDFTVGAMLRSGIALRRALRECQTLEAAAGTVVRYFHDHCVDLRSGSRSCPLVRFYKTHPYHALEPALQQVVTKQLGGVPPRAELRCLVLLGTAGEEAAWNSRHQSQAHRAIPLASAESVRAAPMIARLIEDLGLDLDA